MLFSDPVFSPKQQRARFILVPLKCDWQRKIYPFCKRRRKDVKKTTSKRCQKTMSKRCQKNYPFLRFLCTRVRSQSCGEWPPWSATPSYLIHNKPELRVYLKAYKMFSQQRYRICLCETLQKYQHHPHHTHKAYLINHYTCTIQQVYAWWIAMAIHLLYVLKGLWHESTSVQLTSKYWPTITRFTWLISFFYLPTHKPDYPISFLEHLSSLYHFQTKF